MGWITDIDHTEKMQSTHANMQPPGNSDTWPNTLFFTLFILAFWHSLIRFWDLKAWFYDKKAQAQEHVSKYAAQITIITNFNENNWTPTEQGKISGRVLTSILHIIFL